MTKNKNILRLLVFYRELFELLEVYFRGYWVITTDDIAITYLRLCNKINEIINESHLKEMNHDWKPIADLRDLDPDLPQEEWEYSGKQVCNNFLSVIEDLYVKDGEEDCSFSQDDLDLLMKIRASIKKYKLIKTEQERVLSQKFFQDSGAKWNNTDFWSLIHKDITTHAKKRFDDGYYADAVESACKELIYRVKGLYKDKTGKELDGKHLMFKAFGFQRDDPNPILCLDDIFSDSGKNIQEGYMYLFAGTVSGIRNPKAHKNIDITPERAIHLIFIVSLLMHKLDDADRLKLF
jgi:uncharacterized protein (TIGR02391 family)